MATLNPIVVPAKVLKGGRHKVRISVAHNGETRYIVTDIIIDSTSEFKNGQIVKRPDAAAKNTKLRKLMQKYQSIIDELEYTNGITCSELISNIKRMSELGSEITIKVAFQKFIELKDIKKGSKRVYTTRYDSLVRFTGEQMIINQIKSLTIISYEKYLRDKKLSQTTIAHRMAFVRILINFAKQYLEVRFKRDPFEGYKRPQTVIRQAWLSVDEIKAIRDVQTTKKNILKCRDMFMLSYYLGGINICDLVKINFNEQTNTIKYIRTKTEKIYKLNKYVEFKIPDEAKPIINRYKKKNGRLYFSKNSSGHDLENFLARSTRLLEQLTGIKKIIYYSARKSFSQHAFTLNINTCIIDYILGHKIDNGKNSLYNYIKITPDMATDAIRKVLDNLK